MHRPRFLSTIGALLVLAGAPAEASAITAEEVITLTKLGISPEEIVKAVKKDRTVFQLDVSEILRLKKAGVHPDVIKFMLQTPTLFGTKTGTSATGTPNDTGATSPPPEERELTEEEKRAREERMRQEAMKLLEEKKKAEERQRQAFAQGVLKTGRDLADAGKWVESVETFQRFVEASGFAPNSEEAYLAEFGIANALVKAGLLQSAAKELVEVLLHGPEKPFFQTAFDLLRELRREINYSPPNLEELTRFSVESFSKAFRNEFSYVLGEFFYEYQNWDQALAFLDQVTPEAPDYARAQYLKGLVEVRNKLYKSAVKSFQRAVLATEENHSDREVKDLAFMALARIAYEAGDADAGIYYYRKVPRDSYKYSQSLYESAWVYLMKADYSRALGMFQDLHSPHFRHHFFPELWILEATIYMHLCHFSVAEQALERFRAEISPMAVPLKQFLLKTVRPEDYYTSLVQTVAGKESYGLPPRLGAPVLANVEFYNLYKTIKRIEKEQETIEGQRSRLGAFGDDLADKLKMLHADRVREIGIKIQRILNETQNDLADWELKLKEIEVDLQDQKIAEEERKLRCINDPEACKGDVVVGETGGQVAIVGSDQWEWPFEGEYWSDEIGYHRAFIQEVCAEEEQ
jgi:tetratricopeptide (TPR) repeat protein